MSTEDLVKARTVSQEDNSAPAEVTRRSHSLKLEYTLTKVKGTVHTDSSEGGTWNERWFNAHFARWFGIRSPE